MRATWSCRCTQRRDPLDQPVRQEAESEAQTGVRDQQAEQPSSERRVPLGVEVQRDSREELDRLDRPVNPGVEAQRDLQPEPRVRVEQQVRRDRPVQPEWPSLDRLGQLVQPVRQPLWGQRVRLETLEQPESQDRVERQDPSGGRGSKGLRAKPEGPPVQLDILG